MKFDTKKIMVNIMIGSSILIDNLYTEKNKHLPIVIPKLYIVTYSRSKYVPNFNCVYITVNAILVLIIDNDLFIGVLIFNIDNFPTPV